MLDRYFDKEAKAMNYTAQEVTQYVEQEDVKFIRLAFCDVYGNLKNLAILPSELDRAFSVGIPFDASAIAGFGGVSMSSTGTFSFSEMYFL